MAADHRSDFPSLEEFLEGAGLTRFLPELERLRPTVAALARASPEERLEIESSLGFEPGHKLAFRQALEALSTTSPPTQTLPTPPTPSPASTTPSSRPSVPLTVTERGVEGDVLRGGEGGGEGGFEGGSGGERRANVACTWPILCVGGDGGKGVNRALGRKAPEAVVLGLLRRWCRVVGDGGRVICSREVKGVLDDEAVWAVIDSWWGQRWGRELVVYGGDRRDVDGVVEVMGAVRRRVKVIVKGWGEWGVGVGDGVFGAVSIRKFEEAPVLDVLSRNRDTIRSLDFDERSLREHSSVSEMLSMVGELSSLHTLNLSYNGIRAAGASVSAPAIGRDGALPSLHTLRTYNNRIGAEGASALASALGRDGVLPSLHTLDLQDNYIGTEGVSALASALDRDGVLPSLHTLILRNNYIGAEGAWELASALGRVGALQSLHTLDLSNNCIRAEGVSALASALGRDGVLPSLHTLNLMYNGIGDASASALASALGRDGVLPSLHTLNLGHNDIGAAGAFALASALGRDGVLQSLHTLDLSNNRIGDAGASALKSVLGRDGVLHY